MTKQEMIESVNTFTQKQIIELTEWLLWNGSWYMEDKRRSKRTFCIEVIKYNYSDNKDDDWLNSNSEIEYAYNKALNFK